MKTFLEEVAEKILKVNSNIENLKIIVPTIRAVSFLKESIKKVIDKPIVSPNIMSISEFVTDLSGLRALSKIELLCNFYSIYKSLTPKKELEFFHQFSQWAPNLLSEFNEIDNQLVDAKEIYSYLNAIENIERWGNEKDGLSKNYSKLQKHFLLYYQSFSENLLENQKGYSGLQIKEAVKNIPFYIQHELPYHFFVGFNALNKGEEILIQELIAQNKAEIIWDIDKSFFEDPYHSAGFFIRKYYKEWRFLKKKKSPHLQNCFSKPKKIEIISTINNDIQAKTAIQIACDLHKRKPKKSTAVVLGDENLLQLSLSSMPDLKTPLNITMGYPIRYTSLMNFFEMFFELHINHISKGYQLRLIYDFLNNNISKLILNKSKNKIYRWIENFKTNYITSNIICGKGSKALLLFSPFHKVDEFLNQLVEIVITLRKSLSKQNLDPFQIQACEYFLDVFKSIKELNQKYNFLNSLLDIKTVFESLVNQEKFDFKGDPLNGIQIMGLLETRLLDFDNIILTNVNEGILPEGKSNYSWIPFDVRKKFGMNTFIEKDHLYSYHFFRLLQRAKNIYLLYNNSSKGLITAEPSRFLYQLEYFKKEKHLLKLNQIEPSLPKQFDSERIGIKSKKVLLHLEKIANEGFSPSSLSLFIRNPYSFYQERLLKIKNDMNWERQFNAMEKGTLMHQVLESLYTPYLNKELKENNYDKMLNILHKTLEEKSQNLNTTKHFLYGKNKLTINIIEKILEKFIIDEKTRVKKGDKIKILALEHKFQKTIYVKSLNKEINFRGTVDRIDISNDVLRFIDYKTGKVIDSDMMFKEWTEVRTNIKKSPLFQVLMYASFLKDDFCNKKTIAGVIPLKSFKNDFIPASVRINLKQKNILEIDLDSKTCFENELFELMKEIFDPSTPFKNR